MTRDGILTATCPACGHPYPVAEGPFCDCDGRPPATAGRNEPR